MAELLNISRLKIVKRETSSGGESAYFYEFSESCITYVVDAADRKKYILAHTYFKKGINPIHSVIKNNELTFGINNNIGTQVIDGSSGNVIFYILYFV